MNIGKTMKCAVLAALALGGTEMVPASYGAIERPVPPSVVVESIQFRQRYPWNGLVDIDAKITCSDANTNLSVYVAAWDNVKDRALTVKTIWLDGDETKNPDFTVKSGTWRFIWDARADNPGEISQDVSLSVQAYVRDMRYLVIDLSGGTETNEYAYSFMPDPPEGGWTDEYKTTNLVLRLIPAGTFLMGSPADEVGRYDNETQHRVTLTKPFYMGIFEVTEAQYALVGGSTSTGSTPHLGYRYDVRGDHQPYNWRTQSEVSPTSFAGKLRAKTGIGTIDLPTEARWEYACRAGTTTAFSNGSNLLSTSVGWDTNMDKLGRYNTSSGGGAVGRYLPNAWGLYDMHGNAAEWCLDGSGSSGAYLFTSTPVVDPKGSSPDYATYYNERTYHFVVRGAGGNGFSGVSSSSSFNGTSIARHCRSAFRGYGKDGYSSSYYAGFRICCEANLLK